MDDADVYTIEERDDPLTDDEAYVDIFSKLLESRDRRNATKGDELKNDSFLGDRETNLASRVSGLMSLYGGFVLLVSWTFYRLGANFIVPMSVCTGIASFIFLIVLCFVKRKRRARVVILIIFLSCMLLHLSYVTAATRSDFIPRTTFIFFVSTLITSVYGLIVRSMSLHTLMLINLIWAISGPTMLSSGSPDVATHGSVIDTVTEFMVSLCLIFYYLIQLRYIERFVRTYSATQALIFAIIELPVFFINWVASCCKRG